MANTTLDDHTPNALHQAQGTTIANREQRRQDRRAQEHAAQEDPYVTPTDHQMHDHTFGGPEL